MASRVRTSRLRDQKAEDEKDREGISLVTVGVYMYVYTPANVSTWLARLSIERDYAPHTLMIVEIIRFDILTRVRELIFNFLY